MNIIKDLAALKDWRVQQTDVGFVPTMGALHQGHLSLVRAAQQNCRTVLVSIFINPTQFDQTSDLEQYPKTHDVDIAALKAIGVDAVFLPGFEQLYPDNYRYQVCENSLSKNLCGQHRPGHFDGVLSVVMKLFNLVKPTKAYFGEKDQQQLQLIQGMVEAFFLDIVIVPCPTIREADGLAMSSRNLRLTNEQRAIAPALYAILTSDLPLEQMKQQLSQLGFIVDYLTIIDDRLYVAATLGKVRLIDNVPFNSREVA